jgi:tetratricopeptide (TPR) repeat protein
MLLFGTSAMAQSEKKTIKEGNDSYKKQEFKTAKASYSKVLEQDSTNSTAQYNLGNALYKSNSHDSAIDAYDHAIKELEKPSDKAKAYYNKGVVLQKDKKLQDCIDAYKASLRITPNDEDARLNLQKALQQQKQQQQKQPKPEPKKNNNEEKDKPKAQPKISKKDAEDKLKALQQQENNLQDKLHKVNAQAPNKPEKDW